MEIFNNQESYYLDDIQRIDFSVKLGQPWRFGDTNKGL